MKKHEILEAQKLFEARDAALSAKTNSGYIRPTSPVQITISTSAGSHMITTDCKEAFEAAMDAFRNVIADKLKNMGVTEVGF
jgi:hypothetical protein